MKEDFYESLPLYAKVLFTFAIVSVAFAIGWFTYKKVYKPRLELAARRAYMDGTEDDEGFMDEIGSPLSDATDDEWAYGADAHNSGHSPVRIRIGRVTSSGRYSSNSSNGGAGGGAREGGEHHHHHPHGHFKAVPTESTHDGDDGAGEEGSHRFTDLLAQHDGSGHYGY